MVVKWEHCGNNKEFITQPNRYEIYRVINNKLQYQRNEIIDEELRLYCRECSKELKNYD